MLNLDSSDYIALLTAFVSLIALFLSIYATYKSQKFSSIQNQLNLLMIDKEKRESVENDKADLGANFVKVGTKSHRLKIFNKGKGRAFNINIDFPEGNDLILGENISSKFPLEILEHGQSSELSIFPHNRIHAIVKGTRGITADTDLRLCKFFGLSEGYWLRLQALHDTRSQAANSRGYRAYSAL